MEAFQLVIKSHCCLLALTGPRLSLWMFCFLDVSEEEVTPKFAFSQDRRLCSEVSKLYRQLKNIGVSICKADIAGFCFVF